MNQEELKRFNAADEVIHRVEDEWHYPILIRYGFAPTTKTGKGFVRHYVYTSPSDGYMITMRTGVNADTWTAQGKFGYWADLEPYLKGLHYRELSNG